MTLEKLAEELKEDFLLYHNEKRIIEKIRNIHHTDGTSLSKYEIEKIISCWLRKYDKTTGMRMFIESDNSAFLDLAGLIRREIEGDD